MQQEARDRDTMGRRVLWSFLATPLAVGMHVLGLAVMVAFYCKTAPVYEWLFLSWDAMLPPAGILVVRISNWTGSHWYVLVLGVIGVDAPVLFLLGLLPRPWRWLRQVWYNLGLVVILLLLLLGILALSLTFSGAVRAGQGLAPQRSTPVLHRAR